MDCSGVLIESYDFVTDLGAGGGGGGGGGSSSSSVATEVRVKGSSGGGGGGGSAGLAVGMFFAGIASVGLLGAALVAFRAGLFDGVAGATSQAFASIQVEGGEEAEWW